jgi:hypothetical protein
MLAPSSYRLRRGQINRSCGKTQFSAKRLLSMGVAAVLVVGLLSGATIAIEGLWRVSMSVPLHACDASGLPAGAQETDAPYILFVPGNRDPEFADPQDARISDSMTVIGVVIQDHARAYRLDSFKIPWVFPLHRDPVDVHRHIVNDLIGTTAVTITHCDISHCTRVFVKPQQQEALTLAVGGLQADRMQLWCQGERYDQADREIPLEDAEFQITTWGEWVAAHPDSLVYFGTP